MRVALFGCGWIQDFHARAIQARGHEVVAALTPSGGDGEASPTGNEFRA
jgi:predicted dehydrogenase